MARSTAAALSLSLVALTVGACGNATRSVGSVPASPCEPGARRALARFLKVAPARMTARTSTGNNGSPQCLWNVKLAHGTPVTALVNVDSGPQPYFILERTIVEDSQVFTAKRLYPPPLSIAGLGLEAAWFPQYPYLMATDGERLLTVTPSWADEPQRTERALAVALARAYLRTPRGNAAQQLAKGYPSG